MNKNDPWLPWIHRLLPISKELALATQENPPYDMKATDKGFEGYLQIIFANEALYRPVSDAAVREFIDAGRFPEQNAWPRYITFLRFQCATEFVCQLTAHDHSGLVLSLPRGRSDAGILTWLLIDHWERCFDVYLKLTVISCFFSLPFYGLQPAED